MFTLDHWSRREVAIPRLVLSNEQVRRQFVRVGHFDAFEQGV